MSLIKNRNNRNYIGAAVPPVSSDPGTLCTKAQWLAVNGNNLNWYYENYPVLRDKGVKLPVDHDILGIFYVTDMSDRNQTPVNEFLNCYGLLWEYFLGRIRGAIYTEGQNVWERTWYNIPKAFEKTFQQISNPFGIPWWVYLIAGFAVYKIFTD